MTLHNEKGSFFLVIVCVCLCSAFSCSSYRQTKQREDIIATDSVQITSRTDTNAAIIGHHERGHFEVRRKNELSAMLTIDRDSAGRPVCLSWFSNGNYSTEATKLEQDVGLSLSHNSYAAKDSMRSQKAHTQKDINKDSKAGISLERTIGGWLFIIVLITVFLILIKECILPKK